MMKKKKKSSYRINERKKQKIGTPKKENEKTHEKIDKWILIGKIKVTRNRKKMRTEGWKKKQKKRKKEREREREGGREEKIESNKPKKERNIDVE